MLYVWRQRIPLFFRNQLRRGNVTLGTFNIWLRKLSFIYAYYVVIILIGFSHMTYLQKLTQFCVARWRWKWEVNIRAMPTNKRVIPSIENNTWIRIYIFKKTMSLSMLDRTSICSTFKVVLIDYTICTAVQCHIYVLQDSRRALKDHSKVD